MIFAWPTSLRFFRKLISVLFLVIAVICFFEYSLFSYLSVIREFEAALFSQEWLLWLLVAVWGIIFLVLRFQALDLVLVFFLLFVVAPFSFDKTANSNALLTLFAVTLGMGLNCSVLGKFVRSELRNNLLWLICPLAFSSFWHLDIVHESFYTPRWTGLWNNPNIFGTLMGAGEVIAIGMLANQKYIAKSSRANFCLIIVAVMIGIGLLMSFSRGAWVGAGMGLLYLGWCYNKLSWRFILPLFICVVAVTIFFWNNTDDSAAWYVKRLDFGRPSVQHRLTAWRAGFKIMLDHPIGVGWNNAMEVYGKEYSPPENGSAAIVTNDYLIMGTELGLAALTCFIFHVANRLHGKGDIQNEEWRLQATCRAGVVVLLITFWLDGGLFKLPTAVLFWVLLELCNGNKWRRVNV